MSDELQFVAGARPGVCAQCGSTLTCESERQPTETHFQVGAFDEPARLRPEVAHIPEERLQWCTSATVRPAGTAHEKHELFERQSRGEASDADRERLQRLQVMPDQCWDLLRQRRARREFGQDPNEARVRNEKTVEGYIG